MTDSEAAAWTRGHAVGERELKAAEKRWQVERAELRAEVERLRAAVASHSEDVLDMVQPAPTVKKSLPVDWMKQALAAVWNFPSHPGFHLADSSADQDGEDPTSAWRAGWIAAVGAMQDAVRNVTPDPQEQAERERVETEVERLRDGLLAWQTASMDIGQQLKKAEAEVERLRAALDEIAISTHDDTAERVARTALKEPK
jgi:hypothetical protein